MAFTDISGTNSGRIYDSSENLRMEELLNEQQKLSQEFDKIDTKRKNLIRYFIVGGGAILILALLTIIVKKK
jgi:hypothetical protein